MVPKSLPDQVRSDVAQDMILGVLSGEISENDLMENVGQYYHEILQRLRQSIQNPLARSAGAGTREDAWAEMISSHHEVWR